MKGLMEFIPLVVISFLASYLIVGHLDLQHVYDHMKVVVVILVVATCITHYPTHFGQA